MCGIFAYVGASDASNIVYQGLAYLQYRGYDSWGIASLVGGKFEINKAVGTLPKSQPSFNFTNIAVGHTRWATHGGVTVANAHPHLSCDGRFAVVHNGIIENFSTLVKQLKVNHKFQSATDTEYIAHYLEEAVDESSLKHSLTKLVKNLTGNNAFIVIDSLTSEIWAYRSGSPLVLGKSKDDLYISSDLPTLAPQVDYIYPMQDGELVLLSKSTKLNWVKSPTLRRSKTLINTRYHMESEMKEVSSILSKPHLFKSTLISHVKKLINNSSQILLTGCGSAFHASLYGEYLLNQQGFNARAVVASAAHNLLSTITSNTLVIVMSQSGETIDTLDFITKAKHQGAKIVAVTNVRYSSLDRLADLTIPLGAGIEVAVASTKAFSCMLLFYFSLFHKLPATLPSALANIFTGMQESEINNIAHKLSKQQHLFVIAQNDLHVVALETALKFKEIGYLHAEAVLGGELKHGPLALITKESVCLIIKVKGSHSLDSTISEIQARGGIVLIPDLLDFGAASVLYATTLVHKLSFEHAILQGNNPDQPRNLAKSVTVK